VPNLRAEEALHQAPQRRIARWEHEHVLEAVQLRLDANPNATRARRTTVEHPFVPHGRPACPPASKSEKYGRKRSPSVVHCN
jgi:hypothetical protein